LPEAENNGMKRDIQFEVSQYLNSPLFSLKDDPFMIWDQIKLTYPSLFSLTLKYLQIPATSVPAERLFSKTDLPP
jgi:hypothetical protein